MMPNPAQAAMVAQHAVEDMRVINQVLERRVAGLETAIKLLQERIDKLEEAK